MPPDQLPAIILPSHMGHSLLHRDRGSTGGLTSILRRYEQWRDDVILGRIVPAYAKLLTKLMKYRYATIAVCLAVFIGSLGMVAGERLEFTFLPSSDTPRAWPGARMSKMLTRRSRWRCGSVFPRSPSMS